jgi:hypothetical protein
MHDEKSIWVLEKGDAVNIWSWNMEGTQVCNKKDLTPRKLEQNELTRFLKKTHMYLQDSS